MDTSIDIQKILKDHKLWLEGKGGERVDMRFANLSFADLSFADLRRARLNDASLYGANLSGANLYGADLGWAVLCRANLRGANLGFTNLGRAILCDADLGDMSIPAIENIHSRVFEAASAPGALDMSNWHSSCGTAHCRAGWVVTLASDAGKTLEEKYGTSAAAAMIYVKSDPKLPQTPDWLASDEDAMADMKRLAELEAA